MDKLADTTGWDSSWDRLPDIMLLDIFKRLKEKDRYNASQVCKHWNSAFNFPDIWRKMKFGSRSLLGERASKFASRFGESLHELEIDCSEIGYSWNKDKFSNFIDFLSILTEKQVINLEKFVLTNFNSIRVESHKVKRRNNAEKLIQKLLSKQQSNVRHFGMEECSASLEIGLQFLNHLTRNSVQSLKILHLKHFFAQGCEVLRSPNYGDIICLFKSLVELHINFNCIDSTILTKIAENCGKSLEVLKVCCNKENYLGEHVIPKATWVEVKKMCPKLETVGMDFKNLCYVRAPYSEIIPIEMGLRNFKGVMDEEEYSRGNMGVELNALVNQLCRFSKTLDYVFLDFRSESDFNDKLLIRLVSTCSGLKFLHFSGAIECDTFKELCDMQLEGDINLKVCEFDILYTEGVDVSSDFINEIEDLIENINESQGVHFKFYYDDFPYHEFGMDQI